VRALIICRAFFPGGAACMFSTIFSVSLSETDADTNRYSIIEKLREERIRD
jgi:hypothetical protein